MKIEVSKGNKRKKLSFEFTEIDPSSPKISHDPCNRACAYGSHVCYSLPDPRPKNTETTFCDFCADVGGNDHIPTPGTLEKVYGKIIGRLQDEGRSQEEE